eukprot:TRINITY_DN3013_c0_g1_i1.p1 TRINITY_DN3013_c0_g1~~TRINITY_DN3013_c0_g1_i1.p1  ORF type:complete len:429 (+),score=117.00 TRINITY_DN3013_c0_g1_i1:92-1288(+)
MRREGDEDATTELQRLQRALLKAELAQQEAEEARELHNVRRLRQLDKALADCSPPDTVVCLNVFATAPADAHRDVSPLCHGLTAPPAYLVSSISGFCAAGGACVLWGAAAASAEAAEELCAPFPPAARERLWVVGAGAVICHAAASQQEQQQQPRAGVVGRGDPLPLAGRVAVIDALLARLGARLPRSTVAALKLNGGAVDLTKALPRAFPFGSVVVSASDEAVAVAVTPDAEAHVGPLTTPAALAAAIPLPDGAVLEERRWPAHRVARWAATGHQWHDDAAPLHFVRRRSRDPAMVPRKNVVLIDPLHHRSSWTGGGEEDSTARRFVYQVVLAPPDEPAADDDPSEETSLFRDDLLRLVVLTGSRRARELSAAQVFAALCRDGSWARSAAGRRISAP